MFEIISKTNELYNILDADDTVIELCSFIFRYFLFFII